MKEKNKMKIDIYACRFGSGHLNAAKEVQEFLRENHINSNIYDTLEVLYPAASDYIYKTHNFLLQNKRIFPVDKNLSKLVYHSEFYEKLFSLRKHFFEHLDSFRLPDIFIATYSWASYLISEYLKKNNLDIPLITYITDYTFHNVWVNDRTSLYLVMSEYTKKMLTGCGVTKDSILVFGDNFAYRRNKDQIKNILITGGGLGLLPENLKFYKNLALLDKYNFRIVFGKNKKLYKKVTKLGIKNLQTYGYVDNMEELYLWADLFITKPGGMSIYDSLKYQLPLLYFTPFLPQEIENKNFIESQQIGVEFKNQDFKVLIDLLRDKEELVKIHINLKKIQDDFSPDNLLRWIENVAD